MNFSIIIPTINNANYLKLAINSIIKNSTFKHEIIVHLNGKDNETLTYLKEIQIMHHWKLQVIILYMLMMICIFYLNGI